MVNIVKDLSVEHVLMFVISAFLLYHLIGGCSCGMLSMLSMRSRDGFSVGGLPKGEPYDPFPKETGNTLGYSMYCEGFGNALICPNWRTYNSYKSEEEANNMKKAYSCITGPWYEDDICTYSAETAKKIKAEIAAKEKKEEAKKKKEIKNRIKNIAPYLSGWYGDGLFSCNGSKTDCPIGTYYVGSASTKNQANEIYNSFSPDEPQEKFYWDFIQDTKEGRHSYSEKKDYGVSYDFGSDCYTNLGTGRKVYCSASKTENIDDTPKPNSCDCKNSSYRIGGTNQLYDLANIKDLERTCISDNTLTYLSTGGPYPSSSRSTCKGLDKSQCNYSPNFCAWYDSDGKPTPGPGPPAPGPPAPAPPAPGPTPAPDCTYDIDDCGNAWPSEGQGYSCNAYKNNLGNKCVLDDTLEQCRDTNIPCQAPTPGPAPAPAPGPAPVALCDPTANPPQFCPGGIPCPQCGKDACPCPKN